MRKPKKYDELSPTQCPVCGKKLKWNVVLRKTGKVICYKCYKAKEAKRGHFIKAIPFFKFKKHQL